MTSAELIETHRGLYLWGDQSATDIGGFDARCVGVS